MALRLDGRARHVSNRASANVKSIVCTRLEVTSTADDGPDGRRIIAMPRICRPWPRSGVKKEIRPDFELSSPMWNGLLCKKGGGGGADSRCG